MAPLTAGISPFLLRDPPSPGENAGGTGDAASRAGTKAQAILDALKNPTKIVEDIDKQGRPFQIFTGQNARAM